MRLLVGLGNPGPEHAHNRHNVGFLAAGEIARRYSFGPAKARFKGEYFEGNISNEKIGILLPLTYMNLSGQAVSNIVQFYKIANKDIFVLHDEIDLEPGRVKVKRGGSSAGHNGLRSLDQHIGIDYWRIRLGVGHPGNREAVKYYVLNDFAKIERPLIANMIDAITGAFPLLLTGETNLFMNQVSLNQQKFMDQD